MRVLLSFTFFLAAVVAAAAQTATAGKTAPADNDVARIVGHSFIDNGAMEFLETLTDTIGGRITGSPGSREAAELILRSLQNAGFENAHMEEYKLTSVWQHGPTTGEVVSPIQRALIIGS